MPRSLFVLVLALVAGCSSAPPPLEGEALAKLEADVRAAAPGEVRVTAIGPSSLASYTTATAVNMPLLYEGNRLAEFALYDGYFKVAFVVVDELRALGVPCALAPAIWATRVRSTDFELRGHLDDESVTTLLVGSDGRNAGEILPLSPADRRELLVARLTLNSARTALPLELRALATTATASPRTAPEHARARVGAPEIRARYFAADGGPPPRYALEVRALELAATDVADALPPEPPPRPAVKWNELLPPPPPPLPPAPGERRGHARLAFRLLEWNGALLLEREVACDAVAPGTGVRSKGDGFAFAIAADDPLAAALRGCARAFAAAALPALRAGPRR